MSQFIKTLKDNDSNIIYPVTTAKGVFYQEGEGDSYTQKRMSDVVADHNTELALHTTQLNGLYFGKDSSGRCGYATSADGAITPFRNPTGNAIAAEVLSGKIFSSAELENAVGTMPNNGAWTSDTTDAGNVSIPAGYHNGSGYISGKGAYNTGYKAGYNDGYAIGVDDGMAAWITGSTVDKAICSAVGADARYSKTDSNDPGTDTSDYNKTFSVPYRYNGGTLYQLIGRFNGSAFSYLGGASGNGSYTLLNASGSTISTQSFTSQAGGYNDNIYTDFVIDFLNTPYEVKGNKLSLKLVAHAEASCGTTVGGLALAKAEFTFTARYKVLGN